MNEILGTDREGRRWALLDIDGELRARLVAGDHTPAAMLAADVVDAYGPLVLAPARPNLSDLGRAAFLDTIDLVASDPETAEIAQIAAVATFARSIVAAETEHR